MVPETIREGDVLRRLPEDGQGLLDAGTGEGVIADDQVESVGQELDPHVHRVFDARHLNLETAAPDLPLDEPGIVLRVLDDEEAKDAIGAQARNGWTVEHGPDFSHCASVVTTP